MKGNLRKEDFRMNPYDYNSGYKQTPYIEAYSQSMMEINRIINSMLEVIAKVFR